MFSNCQPQMSQVSFFFLFAQCQWPNISVDVVCPQIYSLLYNFYLFIYFFWLKTINFLKSLSLLVKNRYLLVTFFIVVVMFSTKKKKKTCRLLSQKVYKVIHGNNKSKYLLLRHHIFFLSSFIFCCANNVL